MSPTEQEKYVFRISFNIIASNVFWQTDKDEAYPLGFIKNFQRNTGSLWCPHVWLRDSHFSFPLDHMSWEMLMPALLQEYL